MHRFADIITANSHTNRLEIIELFPNLKNKIFTIYNTVDLVKFRPSDIKNNTVRFVIASSHQWKKNSHNLIKAAKIVKESNPDIYFHIDWYGRAESDTSPYDSALELINELKLTEYFRLLSPSKNIQDEYQNCSAVILPSFYEGLPNTICEAMACGKPIIMSNVCDAGNLVQDGVNGYLFNPAKPDDIAEKITMFINTNDKEQNEMGIASRQKAEYIFDEQKFLENYTSVFKKVLCDNKLKIEHWLPEVPDSAKYI